MSSLGDALHSPLRYFTFTTQQNLIQFNKAMILFPGLNNWLNQKVNNRISF